MNAKIIVFDDKNEYVGELTFRHLSDRKIKQVSAEVADFLLEKYLELEDEGDE